MTGSFRRSDILARIGDAQFGILAVDSTVPGAALLRQRLERCLALFSERSQFRSLRFAVHGGMWTYEDHAAFPEFLDTVESGLRGEPSLVQVPE